MDKKTFIFENYGFNAENLTASFTYSFDHETFFTEKVQFEQISDGYNKELLDQALFLAFLLIGVSYYKLYPRTTVSFASGGVDEWQARFLNKVYQEGLSQYAYENGLTRSDLAHFAAAVSEQTSAITFDGKGILALQSGGKDSLLTADSLLRASKQFTQFYISSGSAHPAVLDTIGQPIVVAHRQIDLDGIRSAMSNGGLNGHVPVTYIVEAISLLQATLLGKNEILVSIGHEGEEPHDWIGDLPVNHQWSKTWEAEQLFVEYVHRYISPDLRVGSPLRQYSELKIAELFANQEWVKFGHTFSSCNRANYKQGKDNTQLTWCGECPKCANAYLLFAPFLDPSELKALFNGQDLFEKPLLQETFKGLLGVGGAIKPFECVGEVDELRTAYYMAQKKGGFGKLPFEVPEANYGYLQLFPAQSWAIDLIAGEPVQKQS